LELNGQTLPIRSDIVSKWAALADADCVRFETDEKLNIKLSSNGSSLKLCPIDLGENPPLFPIQVKIDAHDEIRLAFDPQPLFDKAKSLRAGNKERKTTEAKAKAERIETAYRERYEAAKAALTPANIKREVKRLQRFRRFKQWAKRCERIMTHNPPNVFEIVELPDFQMFDPEYLPTYARAFDQYHTTKQRLENFRPRSWRSKGLEQKQKAFNIARANLEQVAMNAVAHHARREGFSIYNFNLYEKSTYDQGNPRHARKVVREYVRNQGIPQ
jgi:hypothetical protein